MVNALFSSKALGTKQFILDGVSFGWGPIISMYERECKRVSYGLTRMVPGLKEVHVIRDSWTKLNVTPAKIMQVCSYIIQHNIIMVLTYSKSTYCQSYIITLMKTHKLMQTEKPWRICNKLFERGFLSHSRIMDMSSEVLQSINEGYHCFTSWLDQILENGM